MPPALLAGFFGAATAPPSRSRSRLHPWVETGTDLHPQIDLEADVRAAVVADHAPMTTTDYLIDSALVLLVLLQIKERRLTTASIVRPIVIVGVAVANYFHNIPTAGNDLVLIAVLALTGLSIGVASALTVHMRRGGHGEALARAGWASACFWVLGMGSRFAFLIWISHGGASSIASFSAAHSITSGAAWTDALLSMAVLEVLGRSLTMAMRRHRLETSGAAEIETVATPELA
jgi:hypothetical protein